MTLFSIVNTMTELPGIEKVQFLIEGQKQDAYIHVAFSEPFKRNNSIIQKSPSEIKAEVEAKSQEAIKAIKEKIWKSWPKWYILKKVCCSPLFHIELEKHKVFTKDQLKILWSRKKYISGENMTAPVTR